jgi:hypothetical protein
MFKRFFAFIAVATFFISCANQQSTLPKVPNNNKTTIYYVHRNDCPACVYMDSVLKQNSIKDIISKKFNLVRVDYKDQSILPKKSMITFKTPTLYFLKGNKEIHKPIHALNPKRFKELLQNLE